MYPFALLIGGLLLGSAAFLTGRFYLLAGLVLTAVLAVAGIRRLTLGRGR